MIVPVKRLTLIALKEEKRKIAEALQPLSAVEIISLSDGATNNESLDKALESVSKLDTAIGLLKPYAPARGLLKPLEEVTVSSIDATIVPEIEESDDIVKIDRELSAIRAEAERNNAVIESLNPWEKLDVPLESLSESSRVKYFCGSLLKTGQVQFDSGFPAEIQVISENGDNVYIVAACLNKDAKDVQNYLKSLPWTECSFPKLKGKPAEIISSLRKRNAELSERKENLSLKISEKGNRIDELHKAFDAASIRCDREHAVSCFAETEFTFRLEGWIRSDKTDQVEKAVKAVTDTYYFAVNEPSEGEIPPSVLKNSKLVTPFEGVNNLYSLPDPVVGIDGTPFMTPFYIFLFGMMLSDAGYGLVLMIGAWLYNKIAKPRGMVGDIAKVLVWGGLSTIVWGVLVGTFFGVDFDVIFGTTNVFPLFMDPMSQPIPYLLFCFALGVIHILFGVSLKIKMAFSAGDWQTAVFDNLSWVMIIVGLLVYAGGAVAAVLPPVAGTCGMIIAGIGALMILLFKGRANKNIAMRAASGLGELYQITSYLSDILSYARLFALGIATGVIAEVFNDLCGMLMGSGNIILAVLGTAIAVALLVFLHVFNIAINTLGTFVHCARLQYVEFYGKFFEAGGRSFKPLSYNTKHVRISDEN